MNQCVEPSPQLISSEWSLQSGLPSQSTETETHSLLSAHAKCPDPQCWTGTLGPLEGDVGTLGVTGRSTRHMTELAKSQLTSTNKALCKRHILHLLCSQVSPLSGRSSVWTPPEWCEHVGLWPTNPASGSRESCQTSSPQKSITQRIHWLVYSFVLLFLTLMCMNCQVLCLEENIAGNYVISSLTYINDYITNDRLVSVTTMHIPEQDFQASHPQCSL